MKKVKFYIKSLHLLFCILIITAVSNASTTSEQQIQSASEVATRLLSEETASRFAFESIPTDNGFDVFEIESLASKIIIRGSSGVSACRGLKWYLNEMCNCSVSWRGDNLNLPSPLPKLKAKVRQTTPMKYRYFFNNCVYGYSMAYWQWPQWERMLDIMALNGIDLPLCLLGQEKVWQLTYEELGINKEELTDFFAGPAWYPWQWMGNLDGWGGPLPQSVIELQSKLQKKILQRARSLGMKPILAGFSGHIPQALKRKFPHIKVHELSWQGFKPTLSLDWQDPLFLKIGTTFLEKQQEIYGTDHYYSIDPFNEMNPPSTDPAYIANMAKLIFSSIDTADPQGKWVLMTWFCKSPQFDWHYWKKDRTKTFFDAIPNNRMLALELHGDSRQWTGWFRQDGWYGKEWIWCAIQNFGDQVDIYGGLQQIFDNYNMMQNSPDKGNVSGIGIAMEGLCYNPVVFELLFDMMWSDGVTDLEKWKDEYIIKRYGTKSESAEKAWETLYKSRYISQERTGSSPLCFTPQLLPDSGPDMNIVKAWKCLLDAGKELKTSKAYEFDLINLGREAMGIYAPHYTAKIRNAYEAQNLPAFKQSSAQMLQYIRDFDKLMGCSEHFLLGKWIEGFRNLSNDPQEKQLLEWNAKRQITDWGGNIGTYAIKEWSGYMSDYIIPQWEIYLNNLEENLPNAVNLKDIDSNKLTAEFKNNWYNSTSILPTEPSGDAYEISKEMWEKYGTVMWEQGSGPGLDTPQGIAVKKPVTATGIEHGHKPELAVDNNTNLQSSWWATAPASLTVDLEKTETIFGFQVYPYWGNGRYYQYTIETSTDGENWSLIIDMSQNTEMATSLGHLHKFKIAHPDGAKARYVRLNMLRNNVNTSVHVVEFKIFDSEISF